MDNGSVNDVQAAMQQFLGAQAGLLGTDVSYSSAGVKRWVQITGYELLVNATKLGNYRDPAQAWTHASVKNEILQLWLREHAARPLLRSQSIEELPYLNRRTQDVHTVGKHGMRAAFAKLATMFKISLLLPRIPFKGYDMETFKADLLAGLSTGINMTPKGLAFAQLAQVPGSYGLYSAIYPGLVYTFFGSSHHLGVSPSAMMCILTAAIATGWCQNPATFPEPDVPTPTDIGNCSIEEYALVVRRMALVQGSALLALGLMKGAFVLRFFSEPLMSGFLTAASFIIILYQMSYFFFNHASHFQNTYDQSMFIGVVNFVSQLDRVHWPTVVFSLVFLCFLVVLSRNHRTHNLYALIIVVTSTLLAWALNSYTDIDLYLTGMVDNNLQAPTYQHLLATRNQASVGEWMSQCGAMALVGFLESSCAAQIYAQQFDYVVDINQDLVGVGLANIVGSFFFCMPTMGSVSCSAMIATFGGRTGMSNFVASLTVLIITATLLPALQTLPRAALALIVASAVFNLINWKIVRFLYEGHRRDLWVLLGLLLMTLVVGIQQGLILAILLNGASHVYRSGNTEIYTLGRVVGAPFFQNVKKGQPVYEYKGITILRFNGALFFGNTAKFKQAVLTDFVHGAGAGGRSSLILDLSPVNFVDASGVHILEEVSREFSNRRMLLLLTGINIKTWYKMWVCGLVDHIGRDHFFDTVEQAIARLREAQRDRKSEKKFDESEGGEEDFGLGANVFDWFSQYNSNAARLPVVSSEENMGPMAASDDALSLSLESSPRHRKINKEASERCTYPSAFPYSNVSPGDEISEASDDDIPLARTNRHFLSWCPCFGSTHESTPLLRPSPSPVLVSLQQSPHSSATSDYGSSASTRSNAKFEFTSSVSGRSLQQASEGGTESTPISLDASASSGKLRASSIAQPVSVTPPVTTTTCTGSCSSTSSSGSSSNSSGSNANQVGSVDSATDTKNATLMPEVSARKSVTSMSEASARKSDVTSMPDVSARKSDVTSTPEVSARKSDVISMPSDITSMPEASARKSDATSMPEVSAHKSAVVASESKAGSISESQAGSISDEVHPVQSASISIPSASPVATTSSSPPSTTATPTTSAAAAATKINLWF